MQSKDFFGKDRFWNILLETKMYKEAFSSKEGVMSILLSVATSTFFIVVVRGSSVGSFQSLMFPLIGILLGGGFGLLGFLVGGLGILVGSISDEMIDVIDRGEKFKYLLGIMFRFYYDGAILFFLISSCVLDYLALMTLDKGINVWLVCGFAFVTSYFFWYSLMLSVMLLGTSIRLIILRHHMRPKQH
ncbi:hypothetical protein [Schleiferilactobacillus harbinensis]|uniref:hypothetical protein n=1 Tax=Schleiferilactobacillus harbinensis TaxID=304207 RepID=UPI002671603F|nr:hypothetical protein [Schleiferilactobacillus harbinensis]